MHHRWSTQPVIIYLTFITKDLMTLDNVLKSHSSFVVNEVKRNLNYPLH